MSKRDDKRDQNDDERRENKGEKRGGNDDEERENGNGNDEGEQEREEYRLHVPLDASHLEELREEKPQGLQVVGKRPDGTILEAGVQLAEGEGVAEFTFDSRPDSLGVYVGPSRAEPEELVKSQTITANVPEEQWVDTRELKLDPIRIPAYHWEWWYRWCREFTIRGRLLCPDGSPVPGAKVCAKDVDAWFYWSSTQEVGCDTTDENGAFEITFRWCCGFWPWWWWQNRAWRPDPLLVERIRSAVAHEPELSLARAGTQPRLDVFDDFIDDRPFTASQSLPEVEPDQLEQIRNQLVDRLPEVPELRQLNVWPWVPWRPWWDCTPDIIFEATQGGTVVLDEDIGDTRWNISTSESVTLTTTDEALCRGDCQEPPCEGGECLIVTKVCNATINNVGGNLGAPATPEGYLNPGSPSPGAKSHNGDHPFAGTVKLYRNVGTLLNVDYLGFEVNDGTGWKPVPKDGVKDFQRDFYDTSKTGAAALDDVPFKFNTIDGHYVVETRGHYEAASGFTWDQPGADRFWLKHRNLLVPIDSEAFEDGTYRFRAIGWEETAGGDELTNRRVLPLCGSEDDDEEEEDVEVVLTFDNRLNPDPAHPTSHPSGPGTVHTPVTEPDTDIIAVRVDGEEVNPCDVVAQTDGDLEIDFLAHDPVDPTNPTGHLSHYSLIATYGENKKVDLLDKRKSLDPLPAGSSPPPYPGPTYGEALGQGATRPNWEGGRYRLTVDLDDAFPKPCCYQLELRAYKRTIVNCNGGHPHRNLSEYTIGYGV